MLIHVEDLKKGDEVLVTSNGRFRYLKLLRDMKINPKTGKYSVVKCSTRMDLVEHSWRNRNGNVIYDEVYTATADEHNHEISVNFRWKNIWLVKREY